MAHEIVGYMRENGFGESDISSMLTPMELYDESGESLIEPSGARGGELPVGTVQMATLLPVGMTRSGALALLHRLGPRALLKWATHKERSTLGLFERANGLF